MHKIIAGLILAAALVAGCGEETLPESAPLTSAEPKATSAPAPKATEPSRPGDPAVYARIAKMTDCNELQEQFDLAERTSQREGGPQGATWSEIGIVYMTAADERMRKVGCE
jgi:hypothetical protein